MRFAICSGVIKAVGHSLLSGRKAAEGCRTPKPSVLEARARVALAFWTAAALCRFFRLPAKTDTSNRTPLRPLGRLSLEAGFGQIDIPLDAMECLITDGFVVAQ